MLFLDFSLVSANGLLLEYMVDCIIVAKRATLLQILGNEQATGNTDEPTSKVCRLSHLNRLLRQGVGGNHLQLSVWR